MPQFQGGPNKNANI